VALVHHPVIIEDATARCATQQGFRLAAKREREEKIATSNPLSIQDRMKVHESNPTTLEHVTRIRHNDPKGEDTVVRRRDAGRAQTNVLRFPNIHACYFEFTIQKSNYTTRAAKRSISLHNEVIHSAISHIQDPAKTHVEALRRMLKHSLGTKKTKKHATMVLRRVEPHRRCSLSKWRRCVPVYTI